MVFTASQAILDVGLFPSSVLARADRGNWEKTGANVCSSDFMVDERADSLRTDGIYRHYHSDDTTSSHSEHAHQNNDKLAHDVDRGTNLRVALLSTRI